VGTWEENRDGPDLGKWVVGEGPERTAQRQKREQTSGRGTKRITEKTQDRTQRSTGGLEEHGGVKTQLNEGTENSMGTQNTMTTRGDKGKGT